MHVVLILALGLLAYSNTFDAPFQWDEEYYITDNPVVKDITYFLEPSKAQDIAPGLLSSFKSRYVAYLTFALNYRLHGTGVTGYHAVNFAIHFANAMLLYALVLLIFRSPFAGPSPLRRNSAHLALFAGLVFISHPIQTEAVTYLFQRIASLAAFFYLLSLVSYARARDAEGSSPGFKPLGLYVLSFAAAVLAMKTKENAFTLPVAIALYEFCFHRESFKGRALRLTPFFLTMLIVPLTLVNIDKPAGEVMAEIQSLGYGKLSRWEYLFTQFRVMVTYLRLLFLPVNQTIDYDYTLYHSLFVPQVFLSFLFLASTLGAALYFLFRPRASGAFDSRIAAFGVAFFFLALSVESSFIPIPMLIDEYRVYLPSAGFFVAVSTGLFLLLKSARSRALRSALSVLVVALPLLLCLATYQRNEVWGSKMSLWKDVVEKSPRKARGYNNLGGVFEEKGFLERALELYQKAHSLEVSAEAHVNLCRAYNKQGRPARAIEHCRAALSLPPKRVHALAHNNLGLAYAGMGMTERAVEHVRSAVELRPESAEFHTNLGFVHLQRGSLEEAEEEFETAIELRPDYIDAHFNLARLYADTGRLERAAGALERLIRLEPNLAKAHNTLGIVYARIGMPDRAIEHFRAALEIDPSDPRTYHNMANAYEMKGMSREAREYRRRAEELGVR